MTASTRTYAGEPTSRMDAVGARHPARAAEGTPRLVILTGTGSGRRFALQGPSIVVGRSEECDVQLDDTKVSRRHVRLSRWEDGGWILEDLGSRNGTLVNGQPVQVRTLALGDRIQLSGETLLLFTQQHPLEDLLHHRQQMEVIGQLAAGIAHDFNNLIHVIGANLAHLETLDPSTALGDPEVAECRSDMRAAALRASELTGRLLNVARRPEERGGESARDVDLSVLCEDALKLARRTFDRAIVIEQDVEPGLTVAGDASALHQLLMNLCINARDAMPSGGVLTVTARRHLEPPPGAPWGGGPHVLVEVRDTGVGMDEPTRSRLFEPFFTTKENGAGSGLGLATVYEVATTHGGFVQVESAPGAGSVFRVALPEHLARAGERHERRRKIDTSDGEGRPTSAGRVLVVDDQPLVRRSLGRLLGAAGHEVLYASDGEEALRVYAAARPHPDVVLMDLDMPKLGGAEALTRLRERYGDVRVVLISGYHDEARTRSLIEAGAADFLPKPVDAQKLRDSIGLALRLPAVSF